MLGSVVDFPSGPNAQPSGIFSPDFALTDISLFATTLADWSIIISISP